MCGDLGHYWETNSSGFEVYRTTTLNILTLLYADDVFDILHTGTEREMRKSRLSGLVVMAVVHAAFQHTGQEALHKCYQERHSTTLWSGYCDFYFPLKKSGLRDVKMSLVTQVLDSDLGFKSTKFHFLLLQMGEVLEWVNTNRRRRDTMYVQSWGRIIFSKVIILCSSLIETFKNATPVLMSEYVNAVGASGI